MTVIQAATLADFDLLWDARKDICTLPWTEPLRHEAMTLYFSIKCAHEEIQCLNVEIRRLITFMIDKRADFYHAIANTLFVDPRLASYLSRKWEHHNEVSTHIAHRLYKTSQLVGFQALWNQASEWDVLPLVNPLCHFRTGLSQSVLNRAHCNILEKSKVLLREMSTRRLRLLYSSWNLCRNFTSYFV